MKTFAFFFHTQKGEIFWFTVAEIENEAIEEFERDYNNIYLPNGYKMIDGYYHTEVPSIEELKEVKTKPILADADGTILLK